MVVKHNGYNPDTWTEVATISEKILKDLDKVMDYFKSKYPEWFEKGMYTTNVTIWTDGDYRIVINTGHNNPIPIKIFKYYDSNIIEEQTSGSDVRGHY